MVAVSSGYPKYYSLFVCEPFIYFFLPSFCVYTQNSTTYHSNTAKMMDTEPLIRVTVCVNRKKGTTEEEFNKYWAYEHGPLALDWLLRCGIVRYVQVGSKRNGTR